MDWLNWAIRIATVLGGVFFLACFYVGAHSLFTAWRSELVLWEAKRQWLALQREEAAKAKGIKPKSKPDDEEDENK
jgi:hypothetical protein